MHEADRISQQVCAWLDGLPPLSQSKGTKRKRRVFLSPPPSIDMSFSPLPKRLRDESVSSDDHHPDLDVTPKAPRSHRRASPASSKRSSRSNASSSAQTSSMQSTASRMSHRQQLYSRTYSTNSIVVKQYGRDVVDIPMSLHEMWKHIGLFGRGNKVIGLSQKEQVQAARQSEPLLDDIAELTSFEPEPAEQHPKTSTIRGALPSRSELGATPSVEAVLDILHNARQCTDHDHAEDGWNMYVHNKVFGLAVSSCMERSAELVRYVLCPHAAIIPSYSDSRGSRRVDFCVYIKPPPAASDAIGAIQEDDPLLGLSINHTNYGPLRDGPIVFGIETKCTGEGLTAAKTQLLIWMEGQWNALHYLVSNIDPKPPMPDFLPGIIVQGHEWYLVASTEKLEPRTGKGQLILWMMQKMGTTQDALGVYSIICSLQYLARWAKTVYWPWFQRSALRLFPDDNDASQSSSTGSVVCGSQMQVARLPGPNTM